MVGRPTIYISPTSNFCIDIVHEDRARIPTQLTRHSNIFTRFFLAPSTRRLHPTTPFSLSLPLLLSQTLTSPLSTLFHPPFLLFPFHSCFFLFSFSFFSFLSSPPSFSSFFLLFSFLSFPFFPFFSFLSFLFLFFFSFPLFFFSLLSSLFFPLFISLSFFPSLFVPLFFPSPFSLFPDGSAILPTIS